MPQALSSQLCEGESRQERKRRKDRECNQAKHQCINGANAAVCLSTIEPFNEKKFSCKAAKTM